jgi:hypothetical protein
MGIGDNRHAERTREASCLCVEAFSFADDWADETGLDAQARFLTWTFGMTASGGTYVLPKNGHTRLPFS